MAHLWSLQRLNRRELAKRSCRKSWDDEVFGQAARLAFYYLFSMFPVLLLLLIVLDQFAGLGSTGPNLKDTLLSAFRQIMPQEASALVAKSVTQLNAEAVVGMGALAAGFGAAWGALNGTWAIIAGLNKAYEVKEERRWWKVLSIASGLTLSLAIMGLAALSTMLCGSRAWTKIDYDFAINTQSPFFWAAVQWLATALLLFFSLVLVYRFGPNLKDRRWQWSVPGAVVAVMLWIPSTLVFQIYQSHFSSQRIGSAQESDNLSEGQLLRAVAFGWTCPLG